jgi:hypothetical protein
VSEWQRDKEKERWSSAGLSGCLVEEREREPERCLQGPRFGATAVDSIPLFHSRSTPPHAVSRCLAPISYLPFIRSPLRPSCEPAFCSPCAFMRSRDHVRAQYPVRQVFAFREVSCWVHSNHVDAPQTRSMPPKYTQLLTVTLPAPGHRAIPVTPLAASVSCAPACTSTASNPYALRHC